jgi:hypothetical protein
VLVRGIDVAADHRALSKNDVADVCRFSATVALRQPGPSRCVGRSENPTGVPFGFVPIARL